VLSSDTRPRFERNDGATAEDNTALVHLNDATILENLEARHKVDEIYTYTASVLLAVNPYKTIPGLYSDTQCAKYRGKHLGALPPHPYAIADTAYRLLVRDKVNQALLISGESGAGKTETAKIVMQHLAYASGTTSDIATQVQARVLQAQPILESFGNAATLRNSNSSRFGKYNRVYFDSAGSLVDAGVTTYLLESSRVVVHGEGERTYHVFYEMLEGLPSEKLKSFHLERSNTYRLVHAPKRVDGFEARDASNFNRLCSALSTVGLSQENIDGYLQMLAGLIHLADIPKEDADVDMAARAQIDADDSCCVEVNEDSVTFAAELLGMDRDELCGTLQMKTIKIPGRDSMHKVPRSPLHFRHALHSLIKALYKRIFEQIVQRINDSFCELRPQNENEDSWNNIGILDIYGFERLQRNSFEQLCINLANERLQQYFVENVLVAEQQLYSREGLPWTGLKLPNSEPVVNCIGQVFKTLDDFSSRMAKGFGEAQQVSDERFCEKVVKECAQDPVRKDVLKAPKLSAKNARQSIGMKANEIFIITHYAGAVDYNTQGWLDKNNDRLLAECEELILDSSVSFVKAMGEEDSKQTFRSISGKYSKDLEALLQTLSEANLHYIRCFKPNSAQKPDLFNGQLVLDQIIQCGTIELVKIMHDGFPNRCGFEELHSRFKALLPENFSRYGVRTFIEALMLAYEVPRAEWALGMTRLFLKAGQLKALEDMRAEGASPKTENLEKIVKQIIRKRWSRAVVAIRLCLWLPKLLRQINVKRAACSLTATTLVTSRLAPRLEAARHRVAARRQTMRRKLAGSFRTVHCLNVAWRQIREQRKARLAKALRVYALIASRTTIWLEKARECVREAAKRREREEERRRQELEAKMKAEEERLREEAEKRRQEEEEQRRLEAEKRKQEEEEREKAEAEKRRQDEEAEAERCRVAEEERLRVAAEEKRLQEERQLEVERQKAELEKQRLEQEREREEQLKQLEIERERQRQELEAQKSLQMQEMESQKAILSEQLAAERRRYQEEMKEEMKKEAEKMSEALKAHTIETERRVNEEMERQRQEMEQKMQQETVRRLSMQQESSVCSRFTETVATTEVVPASMAGEDAETDIGDSVSVALAQRNVQASGQDVQALVQMEVARLMKAQGEMAEKLAKQVEDLKEKNRRLSIREECSESPLAVSPPANGTPQGSNDKAFGMSPIQVTPNSSQKQRSGHQVGSSRRYSLLSGLDSASRLSMSSKSIRDRRQSSAQEAMAVGLADSGSRSSMVGAPVGGVGNHSAQRKWWAEQRSFLMEDLYPGNVLGTPTPSRNKPSKREDGSESRQIVQQQPEQQSGRKLASEFDETAAEIDKGTKLKKPGFATKRLSQ